MNATTFQLKIAMEEVATFQASLESMLAEVGFSADLVHDLSLISEELLVNIISYGFPSESLDGLIEITLELGADRVVSMEFRDNGIAFDPLAAPERDPDDERLGGWGIPMLKAMSDEVSYQRVGEYNILRFTRTERDS